MTEKIEWYKEVLELEPNSKVFFPLARLLAEEHRFDEAVAALEHGLARHPEFLEARLFLIELLFSGGKSDACAAQVKKLDNMFSGYTGFWQAWAACLSSSGGSQGTATALRFLAATFLNGSVTLQDALERGLASLAAAPAAAVSAPKPSRDSGVDRDEEDAPVTLQAPIFKNDFDPLLSIDDVDDAPSLSTADESAASFAADASVALDAFADADDAVSVDGATEEADADAEAFSAYDAQSGEEGEESEERFSLRTRSMAEVLAEQGDIRSALDIYHELAAAAVDAEEGADLRQRIATLTTRLNSASEGQEQAPQTEPPISKDKLISMLEALAERVEARAQS